LPIPIITIGVREGAYGTLPGKIQRSWISKCWAL